MIKIYFYVYTYKQDIRLRYLGAIGKTFELEIHH